MMGWNGFGMGWGMWLVMLAGVVGIWVVVAMLLRIVLHDRGRRGAAAPAGPVGAPGGAGVGEPESPLAILDRRLVSGEIDIDEYVQLRRTLTSGH